MKLKSECTKFWAFPFQKISLMTIYFHLFFTMTRPSNTTTETVFFKENRTVSRASLLNVKRLTKLILWLEVKDPLYEQHMVSLPTHIGFWHSPILASKLSFIIGISGQGIGFQTPQNQVWYMLFVVFVPYAMLPLSLVWCIVIGILSFLSHILATAVDIENLEQNNMIQAVSNLW